MAGAGLLVVCAQVVQTGRPVSQVAVGGGHESASAGPTTPPSPTTLVGAEPGPIRVTAATAAATQSAAAAAAAAAPVSRAVRAHGVMAPPAPAAAPAAPAAVAGGHTITSTGLWLMARDGSGLRRLLADRPDSVAWSPDDGRVALGRNDGIDVLSVAGGPAARLVSLGTDLLVASLSWSPDGRLMAANVVHHPHTVMATYSELVIVDASSGVTTSLGSKVGSARPAWSARGCLGWTFGAVEIWCPGAQLLSLPPFPGSPELAWSPDGARYAITSSDNAAPGAIRTYAADGSGQVDLGDHRAFNLQWLSDGHVLFQSWDDKNDQLWAQPAGGGPAGQLLSGGFPFAVNGVDDGLIFDTGHTLGHNAIWSMSVSNHTEHQLATVTAGGGAVGDITWARDGRWLLVDAVPSA